MVSVKTTAFYKPEKSITAGSSTTPKAKQKITRKTIETKSPFEVDNISQISPSTPTKYNTVKKTQISTKMTPAVYQSP